MKENKTYFRPDCFESLLDSDEMICISFENEDHTETWSFDDEETI